MKHMSNLFTLMTQAISLSLCLGLLPVVATAQAPAEPLVLDLEKALEIAMRENPTLEVAALEIESKEVGIRELRGNYLPTLNIAGNYDRNIKRPIIFLPDDSPFGAGGYIEIGSDNNFMGIISSSVPLLNIGLNRSLDAARIEKELAGEQFRGSKIELTYNVQRAFFNALLARESKVVVEKSFLNASENLEKIRQMHTQGLVAAFDLIRAEVQTENLRPNVLEAEKAYETALNYLKALIGLDKHETIDLSGQLSEMAIDRLSGFNHQEANRRLHQHTEIMQLDLQLDLIRQQREAVKASGLPSLALAGNYQYQSQSNDFRISDLQWVQTFSAGLRLTIPLFNGFAVKQQSRQLEIVGEQISLQRNYLEDNLGIQLDNILNALLVAMEKTTNARSNVRMAEQGYEIAKTRYETGQGTLMELNDSEMAMTQARFNLLRFKHEVLQTKAEYDRFIGENNI